MADRVEVDFDVSAVLQALRIVDGKIEETITGVTQGEKQAASATDQLTQAMSRLAQNGAAPAATASERLAKAMGGIIQPSQQVSDALGRIGTAASTGIQTAADRLNQLRGAFAGTVQPIGQTQQQVTTFNRQVRELATQLQNAAGFMVGLGVTTGQINNLFAQIQQSGNGVVQILSSIRQQFGLLGVAMTILGGGAVAFGALYAAATKLLGPLVEVGRAAETLRGVLTQHLGADAASSAIAGLEDIAMNSVVSLKQLTSSFSDFSISAQTAGLSVEDSLKIFRGFSTALTASDASTQRVTQTFQALTTMMQRGNVTVEMLTTQFRGIPNAAEALARALGTTQQGLKQITKEGMIVASDILPRIADELQKLNEEAAKNNINTIGVAINRLSTSWTKFQETLALGNLGGVLAGLAFGFNQLASALDSDSLRAFAGALGDLIGLVTGAALTGIAGLIRVFTTLASVIVVPLQYIRDGVTAIMEYARSNQYLKAALNVTVEILKTFGTVIATIGAGLLLYNGYLLTVAATKGALTLATTTLSRALQALAISNVVAGFSSLTSTLSSLWTTVQFGAGALMSLSKGFSASKVAATALSAAIRAIPFVAIGAAIGVVVGAIYNLAQAYREMQSSAEMATTGMSRATKSLDTTIADLNNNISNTPGYVSRLTEQFYSFEGAQKRTATEVIRLKQALDTQKEAIKQNDAAMKEAAQRDKDFLESLRREGEELKKSEERWKARYSSMNSGSTDKASSSTSRFTRAIRENKDAVDAANFSIEEAERRQKAYADSLSAQQSRLEQQIANMEKYKVALTDEGIATVKSLEAMGIRTEQAAQMAHALDSLTESEQSRQQAAEAAFETELKKIEFSRKAIEQFDTEIATLRQRAQEAKASGSAEAQTLEGLIRVRERQREQFVGMNSAAQKLGAQLGYIAEAQKGGLSPTEAAARVAERLSGAMGQQADAAAVLEEGINGLNKAYNAQPDTVDKSTEQAASYDKVKTSVDRAQQSIAKLNETKITAPNESAEAWSRLGDAFTKIGFEAGHLTTNLPIITASLTELSPLLTPINEALLTMVPNIQLWSEQFTSLAATTPVVTESLLQLNVTLPALVEALINLTNAGQNLGPTLDAFTQLGDKVNEFAAAMQNNRDRIDDAIASLDSLVSASGGVVGGFNRMISSGSSLISELQSIQTAVSDLIAEMNRLRQAAQEALRAAQAARSAGGGGDAESGRYGGLSGSLPESQSVSWDKFGPSTPKLAQGTSNTNSLPSSVSGGGKPAILHANEAVVPLPKGRKIPVDLNLTGMPGGQDTTGLERVLKSGLQGLSQAVVETSSAMRAASRAVAERPVTVSLPEAQSPAAILNEKVKRTTGGFASMFGDRSGGGGSSGSSDSVWNGYGPNMRSAPQSGGSTAGATRTESSNRPINITLNVQAKDVDSFKRSEDQIARDLVNRITRLNRQKVA